MASVRNGNTFYLDNTTDTFDVPGLKVSHIIVAANADGAVLALQDLSSGQNKITIRLPSANTSQVFRFGDQPMVFPTGLRVSALTNCVATIITSTAGG